VEETLADDFPLIDLSSQMLPPASLMSCANTTYYRPSSLRNTLASFTAQQLILLFTCLLISITSCVFDEGLPISRLFQNPGVSHVHTLFRLYEINSTSGKGIKTEPDFPIYPIISPFYTAQPLLQRAGKLILLLTCLVGYQHQNVSTLLNRQNKLSFAVN
jgi:hypothetical protein